MDIIRSALVRSFRYDDAYKEYYYTGRRKYEKLNEDFLANLCFVLTPTDCELAESCRLQNIDEDTKHWLKTKVVEAMALPQETYVYKQTRKTDYDDGWTNILREIELAGLHALGFLGEVNVLPQLMAALLEKINTADWRRGEWIIDVNFLLRFLVGQRVQVEYAIPREERLERNLPALERVPLATRLKLGDLGDWEVMLRNAREKIEAFTTYVERGEKRSMQLDQEVWSLWDELEKWSLYLEFEPLWYFPLLERKRSLKEWIVDLDRLIQLLGQPDYALPTGLANVEIWSDLVPEGGWHEFEIDGNMYGFPYYNRYEAVWPYWSYWYSYFRTAWQLASGAILEATEWQVDTGTVGMITQWRFPIRAIEELKIEGSEGDYWTVAFEPGQPAHVPATSNALLLNLQLLLERGGNTLRPLALDNGQLTLKLQTPRANNSSLPPSPNPLPKGVIEQVAHHILGSVLPGYSEVSQQLEAALLQEINRIKPHIPPFDWPVFETEEQELFYGLQEAYDEVVWIRKTFTEHLEALSQMLSD